MKIASKQRVGEILRKYELHAVKKFGQNFITEASLVENIVSKGEVDKDTFVLEIGPGIGSLTEELIAYAGKVVAVELDKKLVPVLNDIFSEATNFEVIQGDILKTDLNALIEEKAKGFKKIKIFGNLPYYITTPILFHIFENISNIDSIVVMMQKEVAQRICCKPGARNFNNLSVACQIYSNPEIILDVSPTVFNPAPAVDSSVVKFNLNDEYDIDKSKFLEFIRNCFKQPRKTLYNNLRGLLTSQQVEKHVDPSIRPNMVDIETYIKLFKEV